MEKLYTKEELANAIEQANKEHKLVKLVQKEVEYQIDVLEWNKKTIEQPIYDEEGEIIGYEEIEVDDYENPIMVEEVDPETGEVHLVQKHHTETRVKTVEVIEIVEDETYFNRNFFNTSLGYVKRKVTMQDGTIKDFLTDILPLLQVNIPILTYDIEGNQNKVIVTEEFINECKQQVLKDFYGG